MNTGHVEEFRVDGFTERRLLDPAAKTLQIRLDKDGGNTFHLMCIDT